MQRRFLLLSLAAAALLAGCGFQLRKAPDFVFDSLVLSAPANSPLGNELRRSLTANGKVQVVQSELGAAPPAPASSAPAAVANRVVFELLQEQREKVVVGLNASGQVREFQLRSRVRFRLRNAAGKELIPETELLQQRDISFNEAAVLAKEAEENLLYRDMQTDIVQQLMRRLAALKTI